MFVGLGYGWDKWKFLFLIQGDNDEGFFYSFGFGVEVLLNDKIVVIGEVSYVDGFDSVKEDFWGFEVGVNYWIMDILVIKVLVYIVEDDFVLFCIGVCFVF